jgi:hypothetical protein
MTPSHTATHFFLQPSRLGLIAQRPSNSLWAFPSGFLITFQQCPGAVQMPLRAFPSDY